MKKLLIGSIAPVLLAILVYFIFTGSTTAVTALHVYGIFMSLLMLFVAGIASSFVYIATPPKEHFIGKPSIVKRVWSFMMIGTLIATLIYTGSVVLSTIVILSYVVLKVASYMYQKEFYKVID
jgi:hypothetical protein